MLNCCIFFLRGRCVVPEVVVAGLEDSKGRPMSVGLGLSGEKELLLATDEAEKSNNPLEKLGSPHVQQYHDMEECVSPPKTDKGIYRQSR